MSFTLGFLLFGCGTPSQQSVAPRSQWSAEQAQTWYARQPWLVGCNFTPSTAINQLEMWQADTWDPVTIDRELGWAQHDILWRDGTPYDAMKSPISSP